MNVVDPFIFQAKLNPDAIAICAPGSQPESVTYEWLNRTMNNIGHRAMSLGLKRGDTVAILVADKIFHVALVLALARLGIITVSARSRRLPPELGITAL